MNRIASESELQALYEAGGRDLIGEHSVSTAAGSDDMVIARLAVLSPVEYDRVREDEAGRLGCRVATLDKLVKERRKETVASGLDMADPEEWPDTVDSAELLDDLEATVRAHLMLPSGAAEAIALWIMHAHAHDAFWISPILALTSPTPACGKTTALSLIGGLVPRLLTASNITAAALFRAVEKWRPTLLIDEADTFMRDSDELRGVVNSGHNKAGAFVVRTVGDDYEPKQFSTWAPKAIALIGKLPPTLASRAIHIELRRLAPGERVEPLREDRLDHLDPLCRRAWRWARDNIAAIRTAEPDIPASVHGRNADNWRPLIAIADVAGGNWPAKARAAAERLSGSVGEDTAGIMLLVDIRDLFEERCTDRLTSAEIVEALGKREERPWSEWKNDKPITTRQLARLLEPFKVSPTTIRVEGRTPKGYHLESFADAFSRYAAVRSATPQQTSNSAALEPILSATPKPDVADDIARKSAENSRCGGVADQEAVMGQFNALPSLSDDDIAYLDELGGSQR